MRIAVLVLVLAGVGSTEWENRPRVVLMFRKRRNPDTEAFVEAARQVFDLEQENEQNRKKKRS